MHGGWGEGGDDQLKKKLAASEMIKASAKGTGRSGLWFSNQMLTSEVSVQGGEFFQKAFLHLGHQQSQ